MIRLLQFTLLILKSIFERNSVVTNRIKKNYRLLVNCKFSDHLSQFAYSLRKMFQKFLFFKKFETDGIILDDGSFLKADAVWINF